MTNTLQQSISRMRLGTAGATLTFAVMLALGMVTTRAAQTQTFTVLHSFAGSPDGTKPYGGLARNAKGNLYGTTNLGGDSNCNPPYGCGVVFQVDTSGKETVYSLPGGADGLLPYAGLIGDAAGNLYGTTYFGGLYNGGTVFKLDTSDTETVLYKFNGSSDGQYPAGGLLRDKAGNLYGTTQYGGSPGNGTVFTLSTTGTETVLHSFTGYPSDGAYPTYTSLLRDAKGNLYGVTEEGGASNEGMVYKLSPNGTLTVLHNFIGGTRDGCYPYGTPAMDKNDNLYGTTRQCGSHHHGIVWKVSSKGTETVLHNFAGGSSDGAGPYTGVIMDATGNLYGDTYGGGTYGLGTVYELNTKGALTLLHSFAGYPSDGANPMGGVIRDTKGNLYGTTLMGGNIGCGTVWKLTP